MINLFDGFKHPIPYLLGSVKFNVSGGGGGRLRLLPDLSLKTIRSTNPINPHHLSLNLFFLYEKRSTPGMLCTFMMIPRNMISLMLPSYQSTPLFSQQQTNLLLPDGAIKCVSIEKRA